MKKCLFQKNCQHRDLELPSSEPNSFLQTFTRTIWENFIPQATWIAQTCPLELCHTGLVHLHELFLIAFFKVNCIDFDTLDSTSQKRVYFQVQLPKRNGGFGLVNFAEQADSFRLGALIAALPQASTLFPDSRPVLPEIDVICDRLLHIPSLDTITRACVESLISLNNQLGPILEVPQEFICIPKKIRSLIFEQTAIRWKSYCHMSDPTCADSIRSISSPEAGLPLSADPRNNPLNDYQWLLYVKRRLGVAIISGSVRCMKCHDFVDAHLEHPMRCKKVGRNTIHAPMAKFIFAQLHQIYRHSCTSVHYEPDLSGITKPECRADHPRADVATRNPLSGKNFLLDFTFPIINSDATEEEPTVELAAKRKINFYNNNYLYQDDFQLVPAPIDTCGRQGSEFQKFLKMAVREGCATSDLELKQATFNLRVAIAVMHVKVITAQQRIFLRENCC